MCDRFFLQQWSCLDRLFANENTYDRNNERSGNSRGADGLALLRSISVLRIAQS